MDRAHRDHAVRTDRSTLVDRHDALLLDLDGVLYRGDRPVDGAVEAMAAIRRRGTPVLFLTNNSGRTPEEVAAKLTGLGVPARADEILTSALATAAMLRSDGCDGATAYVVGGQGIRRALADVGILVLDGEPERSDLVVVGWDRTADYAKLRRAGLLVQGGARLVGTNPDGSFPAADGALWPGAGALLAAVVATTGADPTIVGKPALPMFDAATERTGAERPLMVGDRLDTDVGGAAAAGWDSLLVLSGASRADELIDAAALPTHVGADLRAVLAERPDGTWDRAREEDAGAVDALLADAGLSSDDRHGHLSGTVVYREARPGRVDRAAVATACLVEAGGFRLLRSVAVRRDLRRHGSGLGMMAVAHALRQTLPGSDGGRAVESQDVYLLTETAERFFARLGFRAIAREEVPAPVLAVAADQGCGATATPMTRTVAPGSARSV